MSVAVQNGNQIVVHFRDHRLMKGITRDFHPDKPGMHLQLVGTNDPPVKIALGDLKAVFFVHSFDGDPDHVESESTGAIVGSGRKIEVTFFDDEVLFGSTVGYNKAKPGFFVVPADPVGNNHRVFVVQAAVKCVRWV